MEESLKNLWQLSIWFFGISSTVTIAIFGWLFKTNSRISIREDFQKNFDMLLVEVREIKVALIGDFDKKGLLTKHHDLEQRVDELAGKK